VPATVLDHIGIAVSDLESALALYRALGLEPSGTEEIPHEGVRVAMLPFPGGRVELLEALTPESPVGRFLARRGPGLHHLALQVADLEAAAVQARAAGARLVNDTIQRGAGGHRYVFLHPTSTGGVLLELVEA